jgi:diphthamide synthase (EF-2-diphthine--ammonia ligase)
MYVEEMQKKILLSWSGGKDSAWALWRLRSVPELLAAYQVVGLVTTINEVFRRVAIHGFREDLLDRQADEADLPLWKIDLPFPCTNAIYEERMAAVYARAAAEGIVAVAFGDLFLEDIRAYRLRTLGGTGLHAVFPVWGIPTAELAATMLQGGLRARITCCNPALLDGPSFAGREWDAALLSQLATIPGSIDPCGERGEFHTFCYAGPMFRRPIPIATGEIVHRDGFYYADLTTA